MPQYARNPPLDDSHLLADPLAQLERWLADAQAASLVEPTAMALATVGADGAPSSRMVLYKGLVDGGPTFYTNYEGRKGRDIEHEPRVALLFWWDVIERQVRIEGRAARLPREYSERYFHSRPRASQLSAATSRQSAGLSSRAELERRVAECEQAHRDGEVPLPEFWGGYRVEPEILEFWQGRRDRLHDRFVYRREGERWLIQRLEP